jgi:uncharacterized protein (UPF0335 family)
VLSFLSYAEYTEKVTSAVGLMQITGIQGVSGSVKETGYRVQNFRNILSLRKQRTHKCVLTYHSADNTLLA